MWSLAISDVKTETANANLKSDKSDDILSKITSYNYARNRKMLVISPAGLIFICIYVKKFGWVYNWKILVISAGLAKTVWKRAEMRCDKLAKLYEPKTRALFLRGFPRSSELIGYVDLTDFTKLGQNVPSLSMRQSV